MICALCKKNRELRNSHIFPEFLFKSFYGDKHRFITSSLDDDKPPGYSQKGMSEKLLCGECETKFSRYEKYVSELFAGNISSQPISKDSIKLYGLDYKKFKIFGLSILWRADISSLKMFNDVYLGTHREALRSLLYNEDPGHPLKYGFFLWALQESEFDPRSLILAPTPHRVQGCITYRFVFGGFLWIYFISKQNLPEYLARHFINERGEMIMTICKLREVAFINAALNKVVLKRDKTIGSFY